CRSDAASELMHPIHHIFEVRQVACGRIPPGMKSINWSKNAPVLFCRKVRAGWRRNHQCPPPFDLDIQITDLKSSLSQVAVPSHQDGLNLSFAQFLLPMRKCGGNVLEFFHWSAHGLQHKQKRERMGLPPLFLHVEIERVDSVQP